MAKKIINPKINHKKEFTKFVDKVGVVYGSIAEKIEELLEVLNTIDRRNSNNSNISQLVDSIVRFLREMEDSVVLEEKEAKKILSGPEKKNFLILIREELFKIKELEVYLALAERKQKPEIITKIHQLYSQIEEEIKKEKKSLLRKKK